MTKHPQKHLQIPQVPMAALAMDTIGHLPVTSRGHGWALTTIFMHTPYVSAIPIKEKSAENVVQACLSGKFAIKEGSIAILSDNGKKLKNTFLTDACEQLGIIGYIQTYSIP